MSESLCLEKPADRPPAGAMLEPGLRLPGLVGRLTSLHQELRDARSQMRAQAAEIERLRSLTVSDEMTGLMNRRGFEELFARTLAAARRHEEAGLLAILDLDGFKEINDRHGHHAGDHVLRRVGAYLASAVRASDCAARLGGDEFALLLARCDTRLAARRVEEIADEIRAMVIPWQDGGLRVGVSVGASAFNGERSMSEVMAAADFAMYTNKRARAA